MKNVAILSVSLVALSGTAGLGLSALHEFNMNVQTAALSTPDDIPADSGFVIPDYVPDAGHFSALAPSLDAPTVFEAPALAPVETATLGDFDIIPDAAPDAQAEPEQQQLAPVVREAVKQQTRSITPRVLAEPAAPIFVEQAPALLGTPGSSARIEYVIGVYR
ncbi:MAG: hypothetical protein AAF727_01265 [Pseudomonadota bacterium]